jgi:hypothetical protein
MALHSVNFLMSVSGGTTEGGGYRQYRRWRSGASGFLAFALLLALIPNMLGTASLLDTRTPSSMSSSASSELAACDRDNARDDAPIADVSEVGDGEDSDEGGDDVTLRTELPWVLPPLRALTHGEASLASHYQSFVSDPSTPPPRA